MPIRLTPKNLRAYPAHIFDMDGTLLNSEPLHLKALVSILCDSGIDIQKNEHELAAYCVGKSDEEVFLDFSPGWSKEQSKKAVEDKNRMILEIINQSTDKDIQKLLTQDIAEYLKLLKKLGRKCFVLTASEQSIVAPILEKAGLLNFFLDVQSRNQSFRTKPSSSPYLSLMRKHQLTTSDVIIYEDSPTGLKAAEGTGAHVIHITANCDDSMLSEFKHLQQADNFSWLLEKIDF